MFGTANTSDGTASPPLQPKCWLLCVDATQVAQSKVSFKVPLSPLDSTQPTPSSMLYAPLSDDLKSVIITLCQQHDRDIGKPGFRRCVVHGQYFIKYGSHGSLWPQCQTQEYIFEMTVGDLSAPRVPKVYDYFTPEKRMAYLVMEYIDIEATSAGSAPKQVAEALQWLHALPAPRDFTIGAVGGGRVRHSVFKDYTAPLPFSSVDALQIYMNTALERIPKTAPRQKVSFDSERLIFTQSDMDESNFLLDTNGKMCIVDFEDVGLLPESFANYTVLSGHSHFASEVARYLDWTPSSNFESMAMAGAVLNMLSDPTLESRSGFKANQSWDEV